MGICIKQDGETHRAKDDIEILLLIFLYYPCQKEKKNFEVRFGKIYKRPETDGTFYRMANAGSMVAIRCLMLQNFILLHCEAHHLGSDGAEKVVCAWWYMDEIKEYRSLWSAIYGSEQKCGINNVFFSKEYSN